MCRTRLLALKGTRDSAQRSRVTKYAVEHIIDFIGRTLTCKSIILRTSHLVSYILRTVSISTRRAHRSPTYTNGGTTRTVGFQYFSKTWFSWKCKSIHRVYRREPTMLLFSLYYVNRWYLNIPIYSTRPRPIAIMQKKLSPDYSHNNQKGWAQSLRRLDQSVRIWASGSERVSQSDFGSDRVRKGHSIRNWVRKYINTLGPIWPKMTSLYVGANHIGTAGPKWRRSTGSNHIGSGSRTNQIDPNFQMIRLCLLGVRMIRLCHCVFQTYGILKLRCWADTKLVQRCVI